MKGCGVQPVACLVPVKGEIECAGAFLHPVKMQLQPCNPAGRLKSHCFDQIELRSLHPRKLPLCQTFGPFGRTHGIRDHARPKPDETRFVASFKNESADRHIKCGIATRIDPPD